MKKLYKVEFYDNKRAWLLARSFGGSSVSALFGKNKYQNVLDLFCASINPSDENHEKDTVSTIYGKTVESLMAKMFDINFGAKYQVSYPKKIRMYRRTNKPYMTYTADGILKEKATGRKGGLEIKSHLVQNKKDAEEWKSGNIPQNYVLQILQGFAVINDLEFFEVYAILNYPNYQDKTNYKSELLHFHIEREDVVEEIKAVEDKQTDFQINNIEARIPPNVDIKVNEKDKLIFAYNKDEKQYLLMSNSDKTCEQIVDEFIGQFDVNIPLLCEGDYKLLWKNRTEINGLLKEIAKLRKQTTKVMKVMLTNVYEPLKKITTKPLENDCKNLEAKLQAVSDEITTRLKAFKEEK